MSNDLHVSGAANTSGGVFEQVHISGSCTSSGPIECEQMRVSGAIRVDGGVTVKEDLHVSGSLKMNGLLKAKNIHVSGSCATNSSIKAEETVKISGMVKCEGNLSAATIHVSGGVSATNDVEAESCSISGGCKIGGLLNADDLTIDISSSLNKNVVGQIGGSNILIRDGSRNGNNLDLFGDLFRSLFNGKRDGHGVLVTEVIEGDNLDLSYVHAKRVSGRNIILREGCIIDRIEYSESLEQDPDAKVQETVKME